MGLTFNYHKRGQLLQVSALLKKGDRCSISRATTIVESLLTGIETVINFPSRLISREREVAERTISGATNDEIASELGISRRTVEDHRGEVLRKLGMRTSIELTCALFGNKFELQPEAQLEAAE